MRPIRPSTLLALALLPLSQLPLATHATILPGHLDPAFGVEGKRIVGATLPGGSDRGPAKVLEGADDRLYIVGNVERSDNTVAVAIARLFANGAIDTDFGTDGLLEFVPEGVSDALAYGAVFDAQQRLIVVGQALLNGQHSLMCRFNKDGSLDKASFGTPETPGCIVQPIGQTSWARDVLVQTCPVPDECNDGTRLVIAGAYLDQLNTKHALVAAFDANGAALATAFGDQGLSGVAPQDAGVEFTALATNGTGALAAAGWFDNGPGDTDFEVLRLRPDGSKEDGFGFVGYMVIPFDLGIADERLDVANSVHLADDDEAVVLGGYAQVDALSYRPALVKLKSNGTGDPTFIGADVDGVGRLTYPICGQVCDARFAGMLVLPDGRIMLGGRIATGDLEDTDLSAYNNTFVMRVGADGTPDATFRSPGSGQDGLSVIDHGAVVGNSDDVGTSILLQDDGIIVAGYARAEDPAPMDSAVDHYDFALARVGAGDAIFGDGFE